MKFPLTLGLLSVFALASCETDEPPQRPVRRPVAKYPAPSQPGQYPPQPQPFPQDSAAPAPAPVTNAPPPEDSSAAAAPPSAPAKGDYPYGVPVPGKPGFVRSPYSPDKMTD